MKWIRWIDTAVAVAIVALVVIARGPSIVWGANGTCGKAACGSGFNMSYHDFVHNLATTVNLPANSTTPVTNVAVGQCTLCHTPHSAILTSLLWNHHLSNNTQFTWDISSTMAGTKYAVIANNWNGPTTKCLSCHDDSVARTTINWFEGATPLPGTPGCTGTSISTCGSHPPVAGFLGSMMGTHPVAMPYPCDGTPSRYDGVTTGGAIVGDEWIGSPALPIRIYQDHAGTVSRATPGSCSPGTAGIECSSCHDVHNKENLDIDLLRGYINNAFGDSQYICNECHHK